MTTTNSLKASLHHRLTMTMGYQKRALAVLVAVLCILPLASASQVSLLRLFVSWNQTNLFLTNVWTSFWLDWRHYWMVHGILGKPNHHWESRFSVVVYFDSCWTHWFGWRQAAWIRWGRFQANWFRMTVVVASSYWNYFERFLYHSITIAFL